MITESDWNDLETDVPRGAGLVRRRLIQGTERNVFMGVMHPSLQRVLQLVVPSACIESVSEMPRTRCICTEVTFDSDGEVEVSIKLVVKEMSKVFSPFCDDVVSAIAVARTDLEAIAALLDRFSYWRRLLASVDGTDLSQGEAMGLFGELWVLRTIVYPVMGQRAASSWRGPNREDRDFMVDGTGIEVKTTGTAEPSTIHIASEDQLDESTLDSLYAVVIKLDALREGAGETLVEAVAETRALLSGEARAVLDDGLHSYGYLDADEEHYQSVTYAIRSVFAVKVGNGFPRLKRSMLPNGVGSVQYQLSTSACDPWKVPLQTVRESLGV